jgi:hypothetical protein
VSVAGVKEADVIEESEDVVGEEREEEARMDLRP